MSTTPTNRWSLFELSATYYQDSDCNDLGEPGQELKLSAESNGSGAFLVLSTTRWAISGPTELQALLADFIGRGAGLPLEAVTAINLAQSAAKPLADVLEPAAATTPEFPQPCPYCGIEGEMFNTCVTPACKGLADAWYGGTKPKPAPAMGPFQAHEYGFGKPAGPYPVEAIDMSKVQVTAECDNCHQHKIIGKRSNGLQFCSPECLLSADMASQPENVAETVTAMAEGKRGGVSRSGEPLRLWTALEDDRIKRDYASTSNKVLAAVLDRSEKSVLIRAGKFKLKKAVVVPVAKPVAAPIKQPAKTVALSMPAPVGKKPANHVPDTETINPGLEAKLLKLVDRLGGMKLFKMEEHEAKQALQLLTNNLDQLAWVPGAERLRERLAGCYALPMNGVTVEGGQARA